MLIVCGITKNPQLGIRVVNDAVLFPKQSTMADCISHYCNVLATERKEVASLNYDIVFGCYLPKRNVSRGHKPKGETVRKWCIQVTRIDKDNYLYNQRMYRRVLK